MKHASRIFGKGATYDDVLGAIDHIGNRSFYDKLISVVGNLVDNELVSLVRYSKNAPPDLVLPQIELPEIIRSYSRSLYALDPFYHHWRDVGEEGVFRLRAIVPDLWRTRYAWEFLQPAAIYDELSLFLPRIGDSSLAVIVDRSTSYFRESEVALVSELYPLLASLHRRHLALLNLSEIGGDYSPLGLVGASRIIDRNGEVVLVSKGWEHLTTNRDDQFIAHVAAIERSGPCAVELPNSRILRRIRLPSDFGPAPNGFFDELLIGQVPSPAEMTWCLPQSMQQKLTAREREIVELTLKGYPIIEIARRLGISRGTVKNYRYQIYGKLDITTERELFVAYSNHVARIGSRASAPELR